MTGDSNPRRQALHAVHLVLHATMWYCFVHARERTGALRKTTEEYEAALRTLAHSRYPAAQPAASLSYCHLCRLVRPRGVPVKHCSLCVQCIPGQVRDTRHATAQSGRACLTPLL